MLQTQPAFNYDVPRIHRIMVLLLFVFLTIISLPNPGFDGNFWINWSNYELAHGLSNTYGSGTDYPPIYQYVLWVFANIAGTEPSIHRWVGALRIVTYVAEFWSLWLVYKWIDKRLSYLFLLLFSFLNIAFAYNSVIWGQIDGMAAAIVFASLYFLFRRDFVLSALLMVVSLNIKLQTVIFVPMWGLMSFASLYSGRKWMPLLKVVATIIISQILILLPFMFGNLGIAAVWKNVFGAVGAFQIVRLNAGNMWAWIVPADQPQSDLLPVFGALNRNQVGLIAFCLASAIVLWPVLQHTIRTFRNRETPPVNREMVWLTGAAITIVFFFFNTRMHERYPHMAFIFLTAYAFYQKRFGLYGLFSIAYFLSLEAVMQWLRLENYGTLIFDGRFNAVLFLSSLVWMVILLYRQAKNRYGTVK